MVISYCVKDGGGKLHSEGSIPATPYDLDHWSWLMSQEPFGFSMDWSMRTKYSRKSVKL